MKYLFAAAIAMFLFASCNTTAGLGRDLQKAGQGISNTAEKAKPNKDDSTEPAQ